MGQPMCGAAHANLAAGRRPVCGRGDIALCPADDILMGHPRARGRAGAAPFRPLFFLWPLLRPQAWSKQSPRRQGRCPHDCGQEGRDCSWWCGQRHFVQFLCSARDGRHSICDECLPCHVVIAAAASWLSCFLRIQVVIGFIGR